ncbi:MAG TPA: tetratricopeptide repeat protein [Terriglobia bacterium]|nr:tetratricopeptide repeat protein [Terriglobia bacterium]
MKIHYKPMRGRGAIGVAATVLMATALALNLNAQEIARQHAERGIDLAQSGNLPAAETELRRAVQLDPHNAEVLGNLGTVLAMEGKLEESTPILNEAAKLNPRALVLRQYLAANLWQLHKPAEARTQLQIILKAQPQNRQAIFLLGMVSADLKDYAATARMLGSVPELVGQHPQSVAALALAQYRTGAKEESRKTLGILLEHAGDAKAAILGARVASEVGDYEEALRLLSAAEASNPGFSKLAYSIALTEYKAGRYADCETKLLALAKTNQDSSETENLLGWCYEKEGKHSAAIAALRQAIALGPDQESNYLDLGGILREMRSLPAALLVAIQGVERFPESGRIWSLKGSVELGMSHYPDAITSYSRACELEPADAGALLGLGKAREGHGSSAEAEKIFEEGAHKFPRDARFDLEGAILLLRSADAGDKAAKPRAVELLRKAAGIDSSSAEAHYQLGNLALEGGRPREAFDELQRAARLEPNVSKIHFALARACRRLRQNEAAAREMAIFQKLKQQEISMAEAAPAGMGSQ